MPYPNMSINFKHFLLLLNLGTFVIFFLSWFDNSNGNGNKRKTRTFVINLDRVLWAEICVRIDFLSKNHFILIFGVEFVGFDFSTPSLVTKQLRYNDFFWHFFPISFFNGRNIRINFNKSLFFNFTRKLFQRKNIGFFLQTQDFCQLWNIYMEANIIWRQSYWFNKFFETKIKWIWDDKRWAKHL